MASLAWICGEYITICDKRQRVVAAFSKPRSIGEAVSRVTMVIRDLDLLNYDKEKGG